MYLVAAIIFPFLVSIIRRQLLPHPRTASDSWSSAATVASALVSARLDYVNSTIYGTSTKQITCLQRVQNALARVVVVTNRPPGSSSLHLQKSSTHRRRRYS